MEKTFGEFLLLKRKEKGLTQKDLASKLFVSESAVSKWEKDRARPDISLLPELSKILEVSEHELITASVDEKQREKDKSAKKWHIVSSSWELFFSISYSVALIACLITNFAVDKTLSWFWIVFTALLLSASFTTLPKYIKKNKLLIISLIELGCVILLLGVCCIYTKGDWFAIASLPTILGFIMIFLPIYIHQYNLPQFIKKNNALISIVIDTLLLLIMFLVLDNYSISNNYTPNKWATNFALPLTLFSLIFVVTSIAIGKYLKTNKLIKSSIIVLLFAIFYPLIQIVINQLMFTAFDIAKPSTYAPNLTKWTEPYIDNNIALFVSVTLFITAISLLIFGILKYKKSKSTNK